MNIIIICPLYSEGLKCVFTRTVFAERILDLMTKKENERAKKDIFQDIQGIHQYIITNILKKSYRAKSVLVKTCSQTT